MSTEEPVQDSRDALEKLNTGLLTQYFHRQIKESRYTVLDRITFGHKVLQERHSYSAEVQRVIDELHLTTALITQVGIDDEPEVNGKKIHGEELINYYTGNFYGLVHQAKDKILRLIDLMEADDETKKPFKHTKKINPADIIQKHEEAVDKIGIRDLINEWTQDSKTPMAVILKRRTKHEHFTSNIKLNTDYQNLKLSRNMLEPAAAVAFNAAGIEYMTKLGQDSFAKLRQDIIDKQTHALGIISDNINNIAEKLSEYYKIPTSYEEQAKLSMEWTDYLASLEIKNEASLDKFASNNKAITLDQLKTLATTLGDSLVSLYGVGSVFRDEFNPGSSDLNLIAIAKKDNLTYDDTMPVTFHVISQDDFLTEKFKKERFIIFSDGVLIHGKAQEIKKSEFPKPGSQLAYLLNKGSIERLEDFKNQIESNKPMSQLELRLLELKAVKIMLDMIFGVAMANEPVYTASRKLKIEHIKQTFPNQNLTLTLENLYTSGATVKREDFGKVLEIFLVQARKNFEKIEKISNDTK